MFSLGPQGGGVKPPQKHMFFIDDLSTAAPISTENSKCCIWMMVVAVVCSFGKRSLNVIIQSPQNTSCCVDKIMSTK